MNEKISPSGPLAGQGNNLGEPPTAGRGVRGSGFDGDHMQTYIMIDNLPKQLGKAIRNLPSQMLQAARRRAGNAGGKANDAGAGKRSR